MSDKMNPEDAGADLPGEEDTVISENASMATGEPSGKEMASPESDSAEATSVDPGGDVPAPMTAEDRLKRLNQLGEEMEPEEAERLPHVVRDAQEYDSVIIVGSDAAAEAAKIMLGMRNKSVKVAINANRKVPVWRLSVDRKGLKREGIELDS